MEGYWCSSEINLIEFRMELLIFIFFEEEWNALTIQDAPKEGILLVYGLPFSM